MAKVTNFSNDSSRQTTLLGLPGEIRNLIYTFALVQRTKIHVHIRRVRGKGRCYYEATPKHPALTATCHIIQREALSVYYSDNTIHIGSDMYENDKIRVWIAMRGLLLRQLRTIELYHMYMKTQSDLSETRFTMQLSHEGKMSITFGASRDPDGVDRASASGVCRCVVQAMAARLCEAGSSATGHNALVGFVGEYAELVKAGRARPGRRVCRTCGKVADL